MSTLFFGVLVGEGVVYNDGLANPVFRYGS